MATADGGVISGDLHVFGDFGDSLTSPATATVSGFTGKSETAGLVEFAVRAYDPASRQWVQDDRVRGAVTQSSTLNRYAYVQGAPESFVDVLGFFRAAAALQAQQLAAFNAALQAALDELNQVVASQMNLNGGWSVNQMMASYNQFHASDNPQVREVMDKIAREAFYGVTDYHNQQAIQAALQAKAQKEHEAWVAAEKERVRAREQAKIDAYNKAHDKGFWGNVVDTLSVAGHGVVNFGSGVVNALADTADFVVDVAQTTFNAVSPSCWTGKFCAAIPNIPSIPVYGDPGLYKYSQASGYVVGVAAQVVLTGGAGALKSGVTSVAKVAPRLVTDLPGVLADAGSALRSGVAALKNVPQLVSGLPRAVASAASELGSGVMNTIRAPGEAISALRAGLNNPWDTIGGIFGTPASAATASETATAATTTADAAVATSEPATASLAADFDAGRSQAKALLTQAQRNERIAQEFTAGPRAAEIHTSAGQDLIVHPFSSGGSSVTTTETLKFYAESPTYGPPGGVLFLAPTDQIEELLATASSRTEIELALGLTPGILSDGDLATITVDNALEQGLRLPKPSEGNEYHLPGLGLTQGGLNESVIPSVSKVDPNVAVRILEGLL